MNLRVLTAADLEILEAATWYEDQRPNLGREFLETLKTSFSQICADPELFERFEHYTGTDDVRRYLLNRFPYLVIYRYQSAEILVVAVSHARRKPYYWLDRLWEG